MGTTADLMTALKKGAQVAQMIPPTSRQLGMAESSVKRMLAKGDMPLSRIDAICRAGTGLCRPWPARSRRAALLRS